MTKMILEDIDIEYAIRAQGKLEQFYSVAKTEIEKTAVVQAFEFCFEISWKLMKRILQKKGIETRSPRDSFREAAANNLIGAPVVWFAFIDLRNRTVHTYNEKIVDELFVEISSFKAEFNRFMEKIQSL